MDQDSVVGGVVAAPIGTTVTDLLAHAQGSGLELLHIGMAVEWSMSGQLRGTRSELPRAIETYLWQAKIPHILGNGLVCRDGRRRERQSVRARKMRRSNKQPVRSPLTHQHWADFNKIECHQPFPRRRQHGRRCTGVGPVIYHRPPRPSPQLSPYQSIFLGNTTALHGNYFH